MPSQRPAAFVTGAASGIGKCCAQALAEQGYDLTLVDMDNKGMEKLAVELRAKGVGVVVCPTDVTCKQQHALAVHSHMARFGRLDLAVLNAGIPESGNFYDFQDPASWEKCLDVNLRAMILGTHQVGEVMTKGGAKGGSIVAISSAAGVFPMPTGPVYAAAKAGVVQFARSSAAVLADRGITFSVVCPEFVDTPLVHGVMKDENARRMVPNLNVKLLQPQQVVDVILDAAAGKHQPGSVLLLLQTGKLVKPFEGRKGNFLPKGAPPVAGSSMGNEGGRKGRASGARMGVSEADRAALANWAAGRLPTTYHKIVVHRLSSSFHEATRLIEAPLPHPAPSGKVIVRRTFVGINASDINYTSGRYHNSRKEAQQALPFDAGFETVGVVAAVGQGVTGFKVGDPVAAMSYGGFAEYALENPKGLLPVPSPSPEILALLVSGLTASIALEQCGQMKSGETVLVTAAAGGTGQFAVQLAKAAGNTVIATCSGGRKADLLRRLGADRIVDYKRESLKEVLKKEYPRGIDIVYEGVGGDFFDIAVDALATRGRLIIIGMMASYKDGWPVSTHPGLAEKLLWKSASVHGFFLLRQFAHYKRHLAQLVQMVSERKLLAVLDDRRFVGVASVGAAVDYLQGGSSMGKVVVQLADSLPPQAARL